MQEYSFHIPIKQGHASLLKYYDNYFQTRCTSGIPLRFVITKTDNEFYYCEAGILDKETFVINRNDESIFRLRKRNLINAKEFNAVLVVPTGIGAEIGGHAGDAGPIARTIAGICDNLILHPNVVNASDINEMTENTLYVEGSVLSRLLLGTIGLQKTRANRVLMLIDNHDLDIFVNAAINSVNAARATYGLNCPEIIKLEPSIKMSAVYSDSGRAVGKIEGLDNLFSVLDKFHTEFDAIALSSVIKVPRHYHMDYFLSEGEMLNPWGGVEAMLTHTISHYYNLPSAHSPMFELEEIANIDPGIVDPRMAAEAVSLTFLQCILKGLQRSPKIITDEKSILHSDVISAEDISCLIIPDGCLGLPTLAALEQGITVIAVKDKKNIVNNDLTILPWKKDQFVLVENYLEAMGVLAAIKAGVALDSIQRPLKSAQISLNGIVQSSTAKIYDKIKLS